MIHFLKNFSKLTVLSILFLSNNSLATEVPDQEKTPFVLPSNLALWNETTTKYMEPVLINDSLKQQWKTLVDFTMPSHGNFKPTDPTRRAFTITQSFNTMMQMNETERFDYLVDLLKRHHIYVSKLG